MTQLASVVVPVFNGMPHLTEAVESALNQTYPLVEVVLVDGGSTDGSDEWMESLSDPRVRISRLSESTGAAANWTEACRQARGDFVKLLCQDDVLRPEAIEKQVADLRNHPTAVMAVAQRDIIDAHGRTLFRNRGTQGLPSGLVEGGLALVTSFERGTNIFGEPLAVLFPRTVIRSALPWNDERPFLLDVELYGRVMENAHVVVRKESIGAFRISGNSWSTQLTNSHTTQLRSWQKSIADKFPTTSTQRFIALTSVHVQSALRRLAYRYLRLRRRFYS